MSTPTRFVGRTVLVVGGGADGPKHPDDELPLGIGRAIAMRLSAEGARVAVTDLSLDAAKATVDALDGPAVAIQADASDADACVAAVDEAEHALGPLDVVVCSVGIPGRLPGRVQTVEEWGHVLDVNARAHWVTAQAALPGMVERGAGVFVFVSSLDAVRSFGNSLAYEASKGALLAVARHFGVRYGARGVRSNAILPGPIDSTMRRRVMREAGTDPDLVSAYESPMGRSGRPAEVAAAVAFLASDDASYVNATTLVVDGGRASDTRRGH